MSSLSSTQGGQGTNCWNTTCLSGTNCFGVKIQPTNLKSIFSNSTLDQLYFFQFNPPTPDLPFGPVIHLHDKSWSAHTSTWWRHFGGCGGISLFSVISLYPYKKSFFKGQKYFWVKNGYHHRILRTKLYKNGKFHKNLSIFNLAAYVPPGCTVAAPGHRR